MSTSGFYTGQIGALIRLDTADDPAVLAAATVREIHCCLPRSRVVHKWSAGLDGTKLTFTTTEASDLPTSGVYKLQAYLEGPGYSLAGDIVDMAVLAPLVLP